MNYSLRPERSSLPPARDAAAASSPPDPYEALEDLMVVIEGLCPVWPDKAILQVTVGFLL